MLGEQKILFFCQVTFVKSLQTVKFIFYTLTNVFVFNTLQFSKKKNWESLDFASCLFEIERHVLNIPAADNSYTILFSSFVLVSCKIFY